MSLSSKLALSLVLLAAACTESAEGDRNHDSENGDGDTNPRPQGQVVAAWEPCLYPDTCEDETTCKLVVGSSDPVCLPTCVEDADCGEAPVGGATFCDAQLGACRPRSCDRDETDASPYYCNDGEVTPCESGAPCSQCGCDDSDYCSDEQCLPKREREPGQHCNPLSDVCPTSCDSVTSMYGMERFDGETFCILPDVARCEYGDPCTCGDRGFCEIGWGCGDNDYCRAGQCIELGSDYHGSCELPCNEIGAPCHDGGVCFDAGPAGGREIPVCQVPFEGDPLPPRPSAWPCAEDEKCASGVCCPAGSLVGTSICSEPNGQCLCAVDEDCPAEERCEEGTCVPHCETDDDCLEGRACVDSVCGFGCGGPPAEVCAGFACVDETCLTECAADADCAPDHSCMPDGVCYPGGGLGAPCEIWDDCATEYCNNNNVCDRYCPETSSSHGCGTSRGITCECADGWYCDLNGEDLRGTFKECHPKKDNSYSDCEENYECESGNCCQGECWIESLRCEGMSCETDTECLGDCSDSFGGTCVRTCIAEGEACQNGTACSPSSANILRCTLPCTTHDDCTSAYGSSYGCGPGGYCGIGYAD